MTACVVVYYSPTNEPMYEHEKVTLSAVAQRIAALKGCKFGGIHHGGRDYPAGTFFVPDETLVASEADYLGIHGPADLFGGVVPHTFVRTKAITHPLVDDAADRPVGWSFSFARRIGDSVLPGYTAFSCRDARIAASRLLPFGTVQLKRAFSAGGGGQDLARNASDIDVFLEQMSKKELSEYGLVLESHLDQVVTFSVGQVTIDNMLIAYHGRQRVVTNNAGRQVYGGSDIVCLRGSWDALSSLRTSSAVRVAISQAQRYDAAMSEYPGFVASRRNYDIAQGIDSGGHARSGVLESSWRSGGASTAELEAMSLLSDPGCHLVRVRTAKIFGKGHRPPEGAIVHFQGDDPRDGPIIRYTSIVECRRRDQ